MKKTLLSLAASSLIVTSAMAADKGIDIVTTGQAVVYYETGADNGDSPDQTLFDQKSSAANLGVQFDLEADLKNNFTFGSQLTYLGTMGLEKNLVSNTKQGGGVTTDSDAYDQILLTKIFVAKKIANTTIKIGRQEVPKSLSPFAYTESWNVFKNTFDAGVFLNTDIPDTMVVAGFVGGGNQSTNLQDLGNAAATGTLPSDPGVPLKINANGIAYLITVKNSSIPMTAVTVSYYNLAEVNDDETVQIYWGDVKVSDKSLPLGLKFGLQGGVLTPDASSLADTSAFGIKAGMKPIDDLSLSLAYSTVDGDKNKGNAAIINVGGIKSPLYTQMVYNQDAIALDSDTVMVKGVYDTGDYGKVIAQYAYSATNKGSSMITRNDKDTDYGEFDLIYKVKAAGINYFAAYVNRSWSEENANDQDMDNRIRVWARYNF
ncbi:MAG: hypothetical protein JJW00_01735 [Sulfurimonas sp.]|nr:hypothetical protein [Sulfurimonas sp.]